MRNTVFSFLAFALAAVCGLQADAAENLAAHATATASSVESSRFPAANAIDGKSNTRWSSGRSDDEWIMLDLGELKTVGQIQLDWEAAAGKEYVVQFSDDGKSFSDVFTVTNGRANAREIIRIQPLETRYIRIRGKKRVTPHGYSLWEIKVYSASDDLAFAADATASSSEKNLPPENAVDNKPHTRWSSDRNDNEWIMLDLGSAQTIGRLVLKWEQAAGEEYAVQFSSDGENFTEVFHKTGGRPKATETIVIEPRATRYIRVQGIKRATQYGYSLWEIEAYAK
ncbi:MAG: discoidin domain-containing protein [Lentisphaeria bacterium]|nr:discoidin domain-containing protein [Lentisphaeria bacterium]